MNIFWWLFQTKMKIFSFKILNLNLSEISKLTLPLFSKAKICQRYTNLSQINLNKKVYRREKTTERNIAKEKFKRLKSQTNRNRKNKANTQIIQWEGEKKFSNGEKGLRNDWGYEVSSAFSIKKKYINFTRIARDTEVMRLYVKFYVTVPEIFNLFLRT